LLNVILMNGEISPDEVVYKTFFSSLQRFQSGVSAFAFLSLDYSHVFYHYNTFRITHFMLLSNGNIFSFDSRDLAGL
jgi:hypothetical protein